MATLPTASLTVNEQSGAFAAGTNLCVVMGCVPQSADSLPRLMGSTQNLLSQYGYSPAVDYCSLHFQQTDLPVLFVGLPVATAGSVGQQNNSLVTGTSQVYVTAATAGIFEKCSGVFTVTQGTTVGTDQILGTLSMDGNQTTQTVRLGSNTSYAVPQLGVVLNFGPGTLNVGDIFTFETAAPMWGSTALSTAETALAAQESLSRSWMVEGRLTNSTFAGYVTTAINAYQSTVERFSFARTQCPDYAPLAKSASVRVTSQVPGSCTFAATTITRTTGSWITDGFAAGDVVTVAGSVANNGKVVLPITALSATVLTVATETWTAETDATGVVVTGSEGLTFASTTITRAGDTSTGVAGSWLLDGFAVGDTVAITGATNSGNNVTAVITTLTATVMTCSASTFTAEVNNTQAVSVKQTSNDGAYVALMTSNFATVDAQNGIDIGLGRAFIQSPITGWEFRRPAAWHASLREYQHDLEIPTYRKADGPLEGASITDANGNIIEHDDRVAGGTGVAGRFTCLRSYANGPQGVFVALSLTRDTDGALLSRTHNKAVADLACAVVQSATEGAIGQVLQLNSDGTATTASLSLLQQRVNKQLMINLLQQYQEGPRASSAVWTASTSDVLNVPGATLNGNLALELDGTLENIATTVSVS